MPNNDAFSGVSNCYVFKSRLQEYAQKAGLPTPVYETTKEGPSHEPSFKSTVIVNDVRFNSLPGFFNRKASEQSAAEVALLELSKSSNVSETISQPVHETGLCKNLLQEYAQKMNYAIPLYTCRREELGRKTLFTCTAEIGGIRYTGVAAKTKKEAEIKAARTALIAIQSSTTKPPERESQFTVLPCKKRDLETANDLSEETTNPPKRKKARTKKPSKSKLTRGNLRNTRVANEEYSDSTIANAEASTMPIKQSKMEPVGYTQPGSSGSISSGMENSMGSFCQKDADSQNGITRKLHDDDKLLNNAKNVKPKFVESNGSSVTIAQKTKDPMRYPQLGGASVISTEMESSGERNFQNDVNSSRISHLKSDVAMGKHDTPGTGMSSVEHMDIPDFHMEAKEESCDAEVDVLSGNHFHEIELDSIFFTGYNP